MEGCVRPSGRSPSQDLQAAPLPSRKGVLSGTRSRKTAAILSTQDARRRERRQATAEVRSHTEARDAAAGSGRRPA